MSKVAPLNATIEYHLDCAQPHVRKRYHATYTAVEEAASYKQVERIVDGVSGVRTAHVYDVDVETNSIRVEYVPGSSLWEIMAAEGAAPLGRHLPALVATFGRARAMGIPFDSDPSNLMVDQRNGGIVFIDPICTSGELFRDYAMVVFLWGLIKRCLRDWRIWHAAEMFKAIREWRREYCVANDVSTQELDEQLSRYIDVVVGWNLQANAIEGPVVRAFRVAVVTPLYLLVREAVRFGALRD